MLIASSPIEIEAKSDEAGLPPAAHDAALRLFHTLTDRIGQAVVSLSVAHEDWPKHRFYFSGDPAGLDRLLAVLASRDDVLDVSGPGEPMAAGALGGLYAEASDGGFAAVMVAHEDHSRYQP